MSVNIHNEELFREIQPHRCKAIPNHDGTLILYQSWRVSELRIMNIATGASHVLTKLYTTGSTWLGDGSNTVIFLFQHPFLGTVIYSIDADEPLQKPNKIGRVKGQLKDFRVKRLQDGSIAFATICLSNKRGRLLDEEVGTIKNPTMRVYNTYQVQDLDTYVRSGRYSIFYSILSKENGQWKINKPLHNALPHTDLEPNLTALYSNSSKCYDISQRGIVVSLGDRDKMEESIYYIPIDSYSAPSTHKPVDIEAGNERRCHSYSYPRFSPDGSLIAFIYWPAQKEEKIPIQIYQLESSSAANAFDMATSEYLSLSPQEIKFTPDGRALYFTAKDTGRVGLYKVGLRSKTGPSTISRNGTVEAFYPLSEGDNEKLLVTSSSLIESSLYQIVDVNGDHKPTIVSATENGAKLGLSQEQVSEIYFKGSGDYRVHAWMIRPSHFDKSRKYPLAILVHGGPRGSWIDQWRSDEWNLMVWADQGYVVVAPNITGSTGYGWDFEEAVRDNWGGRPYEDLIKCMEYLEDVPGVDTDNAIIAGASYGGYMVNWIQGHPFGRRFKAMICSSGIFDLTNHTVNCDFRLHSKVEFGGSPLTWENPDGFERYNPARADLLPNWKTPMLLIHGGKDYRCQLTEALAAFHTLKLLETPARLLIFPDGGHGGFGAENVVWCLRHIFTWANWFTGIADVAEDSEPENSDIEDSNSNISIDSWT
ncbi:alpha/beta-hydrolase [Hypoxylon sp. FL1857]|nr:alpha/beta-hydrolase [Hypoxylon sp. FL1857]